MSTNEYLAVKDVDSCVILSGILVDFWDLATQNQVWGLRRVYQFGCKPRVLSCGLITSHAQFQGGHFSENYVTKTEK